jgi:cyclase
VCEKRIIPCLLIRGNKLVKTTKFKDDVYIGDPVNAARIFSDKEVDEIIILDIEATKEKRAPNYELIAEIAGECFMPLTYGGGITNVDQVRRLIRSGIEKVVINSYAYLSTQLIAEAVGIFGSQAVVGGIDVKKKILGSYQLMSTSATIAIDISLEEHIINLVEAGVGELFINSIDRDGQMLGYDLELIKKVVKSVNIPVIACGGAGKLDHLKEALNYGLSAVAAGSMFVYHGKHKAVLINYPQNKIN